MTDAEAAPTPAAPSRSLLRWAVPLAMAVVLLDQITKHWAVSSLPGRPPVHVVWTLQWNLAFNRGMAFSSGQGLGPVIGVLALGITVMVLRLVHRQGSRLAAVAGGLVAGGAVGNVVDRLFRGDAWMRGAVVDFIDFQWFPIFNIADTAVNVGGALFVLWALFGHHDEPARTPKAESA